MDGYLPVKVNVPLDDYRRLYAEAHAAGITVAERIAQALTPPAPKRHFRMGRPSGYTTQRGEEIAADRRLGKPWEEIGRSLGISGRTAGTWHQKYENEVREQNMRDRAGRKSA
jgi:DNA-binding NarL/FixJ family response regulator